MKFPEGAMAEKQRLLQVLKLLFKPWWCGCLKGRKIKADVPAQAGAKVWI